MEDKKTNFDRYLERKLQDAGFRSRLEAADQAWDIALQLAALRQAPRLPKNHGALLAPNNKPLPGSKTRPTPVIASAWCANMSRHWAPTWT